MKVGNRDKNKDAGIEMLKLIITEEKQRLVWSYKVNTDNAGCGLKGDYVNHSRKKEGDMNLEKRYVCACIWNKLFRK